MFHNHFNIFEILSRFTRDFVELALIYITSFSVLIIFIFVQVILKFFIVKEAMQSQRNMQVNSRRHNKNNHLQIAKTIFLQNMLLFATAFPYFFFKSMLFISRLRHIPREFVWFFDSTINQWPC